MVRGRHMKQVTPHLSHAAVDVGRRLRCTGHGCVGVVGCGCGCDCGDVPGCGVVRGCGPGCGAPLPGSDRAAKPVVVDMHSVPRAAARIKPPRPLLGCAALRLGVLLVDAGRRARSGVRTTAAWFVMCGLLCRAMHAHRAGERDLRRSNPRPSVQLVRCTRCCMCYDRHHRWTLATWYYSSSAHAEMC